MQPNWARKHHSPASIVTVGPRVSRTTRQGERRPPRTALAGLISSRIVIPAFHAITRMGSDPAYYESLNYCFGNLSDTAHVSHPSDDPRPAPSRRHPKKSDATRLLDVLNHVSQVV